MSRSNDLGKPLIGRGPHYDDFILNLEMDGKTHLDCDNHIEVLHEIDSSMKFLFGQDYKFSEIGFDIFY